MQARKEKKISNLVFLVVFGFLAGELPADTYNFYFPGKKLKGAAKTDSSQKVRGAPLVELAKPEEAREPSPAVSEPTAALVSEVPLIHSSKNFHMGVGAVAGGQKYFRNLDGDQNEPPDFEVSYGGLLSFGYRFSGLIGGTSYAGARYASNIGRLFLQLGADFELFPFGSLSENFRPFEFAFLLGGSTAQASEGNIGSFHAGTRLNFNLDESFGFSTVVRANLGYFLLETGFLTYF